MPCDTLRGGYIAVYPKNGVGTKFPLLTSGTTEISPFQNNGADRSQDRARMLALGMPKVRFGVFWVCRKWNVFLRSD